DGRWRRPRRWAPAGTLSDRGPGPSFVQGRIKLAAREPGERLAVLVRRLFNDFRRQFRRRRLPVPAYLGQIVAQVLLVEAGLRSAPLVLLRRPEAAGIRRKALVDQDDFAVQQA